MRFLSVCSGIEAASCAWHPLGWRPIAFSEIEPFPCAVLKERWPDVPNLGDMLNFQQWPDYESVDLLAGGTPCQSFSIAGLREGLADPRGNLMLTYLAIAARYRPRWLVWENVPGVLSIDGGRAFGTLLGGMAKLGYGFAYRILDAQYVRVESHPRAVPQRRRRVFVVGCLGDWRRAAAVLFERESLCGHNPPRRETGKGVAGTLSARSEGGGGLGTDFELSGGLTPAAPVCGTLCADTHPGSYSGQDAFSGRLIDDEPSARGGASVAGSVTAKWAKGTGGPAGDECYNLTAVAQTVTAGCRKADRGEDANLIAFSCKDSGSDAAADVAPTVRAMNNAGGNANAGGQIAIAFGAQDESPFLEECALTITGRKGDPGMVCSPVSPTLSTGSNSAGGARQPGTEVDGAESLIVFDSTQITDPQNRSNPQAGDPCHTLTSGGDAPAVAFKASHYTRGKDGAPEGVCPPLTADADKGDQDPLIFQTRIARNGRGAPVDVCPALNGSDAGETSDMRPCVQIGISVRRLMPLECERLQGFVDGYTAVHFNGRPAKDGPRYCALGNTMAVNVMSFIGRRIAMVNAL